MNKRTFNKIFYQFKQSDLDKERAWEIYLSCTKLSRDGNENTFKYLTKMGLLDKKDRLKWRTKLAEKGIELTPGQVDDYILILCLAVNSSYNEK